MSDIDRGSTPTEKRSKLVLISLVISRLANVTPTLIIGLLLVDIATTYESSVGVVGQLQTASSLVGLAGARAPMLNVFRSPSVRAASH
jgi:predicted MFS family arabinose efflux permease